MAQPFIGAFDPRSWTGLVLSDEPGSGFALRFVVERDGERADKDDFHDLVQDLGPHAPDGSYARIAFDTRLPFGTGKDTPPSAMRDQSPGLELEWSRIDASYPGGIDFLSKREERPPGVVVRAHVGFEGSVELRGYFPWDWTGNWSMDEGAFVGVTDDGRSTLGVIVSDVGGNHFLDGEEVVVRASVQPGVLIDVVAILGTDPRQACEKAKRIYDQLSIDTYMGRVRRRYEASRVYVEGHWEGMASAVTNSSHWNIALQPEQGRLYAPAGRRWIFPAHGREREHWTLFCWDSFFNALELAIENPKTAASAMEAVLESQYPNGNVPNWRGRFAGTPDRSQPPVGSFAVLKVYLRTKDRELLEHAFPRLERWSSWWRADKKGRHRRGGSHRGLFSWGSDTESVIDSPAPWENEASHHQRAAWESGQDDLPNWDEAVWKGETETFDLDAVDLNSYLALDLECLSRIAAELGEMERADTYRALRDDLVRRVNEVLWNEAEGIYADRFRDGRFSPRLAASNFLPLLAGIPPRERAERMLKPLVSRFWGVHVIPTISRDDPAFDDQQYWRGSIWPPINYLLYAGLRRYRFDEVAGELATRSVDLMLAAWRQSSSSPENYDSRTGKGGGHRHQSWGPLLALMGIEEFIDVTPWDGLRIGSLHPPPPSALKRIRVSGHQWEVELSKAGLRVVVDGDHLLDSSGPIVLNRVELDRKQLTAETFCREPVRLCLSLDGSRQDRLNMEIEGELFRSVSNVVVVPAGSRRLRVSRLK